MTVRNPSDPLDEECGSSAHGLSLPAPEKWGGLRRSRSEAEFALEARRQPGRRTADERTGAVLDLLSGKATVDPLARRFGVQSSTVERWKEAA